MIKKQKTGSDLNIKIKEFGRPIFKAKGKKKKVINDVTDFLRFKL